MVVTANSGGVVSLIDLEGAARMILSDDEDKAEGEGGQTGGGDSSDEDGDSSDEDGEEDVAAEFLESVRIGSGARITNLAVWSAASEGDGIIDGANDMLETADVLDEEKGSDVEDDSLSVQEEDESVGEEPSKKKKQKIELTSRISGEKSREIEMDAEALEKARSIIKKAKKKQKKAKKKKSKSND